MEPFKKICVLGDSVLRGVVYNEITKKYVFLKNNAVSGFADKCHVCVTNLSKFGNTVAKGFEKLKKVLVKENDYDAVLLEFGGNDCDYNWEAVIEQPYAHHDMNTTLPDFIATLTAMIHAIQTAGKKALVSNLPPINGERYFNWIAKGEKSRSENLMAFLKDRTIIYRNQEFFSKTIEKITESTNAYLVDIRSKLLPIYSYQDYLCLDGIHPNEKGHGVIQEVFVETYAKHFIL